MSDGSDSFSSRGLSSCCSPTTGPSAWAGDSSVPAADVTPCSVALTSSWSLETKPCVEAWGAEEVETAAAAGGAEAVAGGPFRGASLSGVAPGGREPAGLAEVWVSDGAAEFVVPRSGAPAGAGPGVVGGGGAAAAGGPRLGPGASAAVGVGEGAGMSWRVGEA